MRKIFFFLLFQTFYSCDSSTTSSITNNNNESLILKIFYNKNSEKIQDYIKYHKGYKNFTNYIFKYNNSEFEGRIINFDSVKYSVLLKLRQNDTLQIWGGLHQSNRFDEIQKIQIITKGRDTTEVLGNKFVEVFDEKVNGFYLYTVN